MPIVGWRARGFFFVPYSVWRLGGPGGLFPVGGRPLHDNLNFCVAQIVFPTSEGVG